MSKIGVQLWSNFTVQIMVVGCGCRCLVKFLVAALLFSRVMRSGC